MFKNFFLEGAWLCFCKVVLFLLLNISEIADMIFYFTGKLYKYPGKVKSYFMINWSFPVTISSFMVKNNYINPKVSEILSYRQIVLLFCKKDTWIPFISAFKFSSFLSKPMSLESNWVVSFWLRSDTWSTNGNQSLIGTILHLSVCPKYAFYIGATQLNNSEGTFKVVWLCIDLSKRVGQKKTYILYRVLLDSFIYGTRHYHLL